MPDRIFKRMFYFKYYSAFGGHNKIHTRLYFAFEN